METQFKFLNFLRLVNGIKCKTIIKFTVISSFSLYIQHLSTLNRQNKIMTLKALMRLFILFQFTLIANCVESELVEALKILFKEINKPLQLVAIICWSVG